MLVSRPLPLDYHAWISAVGAARNLGSNCRLSIMAVVNMNPPLGLRKVLGQVINYPEDDGKCRISSDYQCEESSDSMMDLVSYESIYEQFTWDLRIDDADENSKLRVTIPLYPVVIRWPNPDQEVYLSGTYDDWSTKVQMVKNGEELYAVVEMSEGVHQYKFLVDGVWMCHPNEPKVPNEMGTQNNIIRIRSCDADIFKVLDADCPDTSERSCSTPPGEYSQYIPPKETGFVRFGPPLIPPHLMDTMLNKETPAHLEPMILPEPLHVVLNHLYTLSIKDGIMVLSATHRYRKKYITTLLYRPI